MLAYETGYSKVWLVGTVPGHRLVVCQARKWLAWEKPEAPGVAVSPLLPLSRMLISSGLSGRCAVKYGPLALC